MNRDTWNGLVTQDKEAIQRAAQTAYMALGPAMDKSFDTMVGDLKKAGVKLRLLDQRELDAWNTATKYQNVQTAWVNEQENKGVKDAVLVLKRVDALLSTAKK